MSWVFHGRDIRQCWSEPSCLVCFIRAVFELIGARKRVYQRVKGMRENR